MGWLTRALDRWFPTRSGEDAPPMSTFSPSSAEHARFEAKKAKDDALAIEVEKNKRRYG